ncbi:MAG: M4 family metallopeptidase [Thermoanaerobaculaceae bacterium]
MKRAAVLLLVMAMAGGIAVAGNRAPHIAVSEDQIRGLGELTGVEILSFNQAGVPTFIAGELGQIEARDFTGGALRFLEDLRPVFRATGREELALKGTQEDELGKVHVRFQQTLNGLPVAGAELTLHVDARTGKVYAINGTFAPDENLPRTPVLSGVEALQQAAVEAGIVSGAALDAPQLTYVVRENGKAYLAWTTRVAFQDEKGEHLDRIYADAITGELVTSEALIHSALYRKIYTANNGTSLPGTLMFQEGGSSSDSVAMAAYNNLGYTYNYYKNKFNRDSIDGAGMTLIATVHYGNRYNNAFWNGSQMVFGDGDGTTFSPIANALDVVAHELTHGVTEHTANLNYASESGALNEAMSDIFGASVEAYRDGSVNSNTWKIGEACYTPGTSGDALRYMNNPTADGYSADYYPERLYPNCTPTSSNDYCGVHGNSGIGNLAYYLLVAGGTHPRNKTTVSVPAIGIAKAEQIFYRALTTYMTSSTNFQGARNATAQAAADLYGGSSAEYNAVQKCWDAVGVPGGAVQVTTLSNGQTVSNLSASTGNWLYFKITVPSGQTQLKVVTSGGSGDGDLYVRLGSLPTTSSYNGKSTGSTTAETVTISNPSAGDWYIGFYAYSSFSGASLTATYSGGGGGGGSMTETEPNGSRSSANVISTSGTTVTGYIGSSSDNDYFKVTVPGLKTLTVDLTVPSTKDYDVKLYNSSGTVLASGTNSTGQPEHVTWYNSSSSSQVVYIRVYGYNGAYSTTLPYYLKPTW